MEYITNRPSANIPSLVGAHSLRCMKSLPHHQLSDVAEGLLYLHSCSVVHGDLKGVRDYSRSCFTIFTPGQSNVVVDAAGHARITDFGLAMVTQDLDSIRNASEGEHEHSGRWIAPEILDGRGTYSKEADVFSFAMVTIEVRCRILPGLTSG